jgi:hypothetical protein
MTKKKTYQWLTTVTPFSKGLTMFLFILFPFIGFYLGLKYNQFITPLSDSVILHTTISSPTKTEHKIQSTDMTNWVTYTDPKTHVSFTYPPDWILQETKDERTTGIDIKGKQGEVITKWNDQFGGDCGSLHENVQLFNEQIISCHFQNNDGSQAWNINYFKQNKYAFSISATVVGGSMNKDIVFKILSSYTLPR